MVQLGNLEVHVSFHCTLRQVSQVYVSGSWLKFSDLMTRSSEWSIAQGEGYNLDLCLWPNDN